MKKYMTAIFTLIMTLLVPFHSMAKDEEPIAPFSYFTLQPEITTNFITNGHKLGFINIQVDLMVDDPSLIEILEYHQPLIRDTIVQILSQEKEVQVKSLAGRESIRKKCLDKVNEVLLVETNQKILTDLLFTKYLYQ